LFFIIEEILDSLRAKKGDIDDDKSLEETEKEKNEIETNNSKDAEKNREELEDQSLEKDSEDTAPDDGPEQGKAEGKRITWVKKKCFISVICEVPSFTCKMKMKFYCKQLFSISKEIRRLCPL
jgi:hypothetical protein